MNNRDSRTRDDVTRNLEQVIRDTLARIEVERHFRATIASAVADCRKASIRRPALVGSLDLSEILLTLWNENGGPRIHAVFVPGKPHVRRLRGVAVLSLASPQTMPVDGVLLNVRDSELELYEECRSRFPGMPIRSLWTPTRQLDFRLELVQRAHAVRDQCLEARISEVAIFGAGSHTRLLLDAWKGSRGPAVKLILTGGEAAESEIDGIPVVHVDGFEAGSVGAIVISSHSHETELYKMCAQKWPRVRVFTLWHLLEDLQSLCDLERLARCVAAECRADGVKRVVFYGAGTHTESLLPIWRSINGPEVVGVIVTHAKDQERCLDLGVESIDAFDVRCTDGIVLSSRSFETEMAETCTKRWPLVPFYPVWYPGLRSSTATLKHAVPNAIHRCVVRAVRSVALAGVEGVVDATLHLWRGQNGPEVVGCVRALLSKNVTGGRAYRLEGTEFDPAGTDAIVVANSPGSAGFIGDIHSHWPDKMIVHLWPQEAEAEPAEAGGMPVQDASLPEDNDENERAYRDWRARATLGTEEGERTGSLREASKIEIGLFAAAGNSPSVYLREMLKSVAGQSYPHWELFLSVLPPDEETVASLVKEVFEGDSRVKVSAGEASACVSAQLRTTFERTSADYVIPLGEMDALAPDALLTVIGECDKETPWDVLVSTEGEPRAGCVDSPVPKKPECSTFCGNQSYSFSALTVFRREWLSEAWRGGGAQGCFLELAATMQKPRKGVRVRTLSGSLYFWRSAPGSNGIRLVTNGTKQAQAPALRVVSRPMRVAFDARLLLRQTTGTERYISTLLGGLAQFREKANIELRVLLKRRADDLPHGPIPILTGHGDTIRSADLFHRTIQAYDVEALREMAGARACVYTLYDLISYTFGDYFVSDKAFQAYREVARTGARIADQIIAFSDHSRQEIIKALDVQEGKVTAVAIPAVQGSADPAARGTRPSAAIANSIPPKYFLFAGTDYPHKNLAGLLRAYIAARSKLKGMKIVAVGVRCYRKPQPELDALMESVGDDFISLGFVSDNDLSWLYAHAVAFVYPSLYEGFGLPPLEAMKFGTPVAASDATSIPEVTGPAALLFDGRDQDSIARALVAIATDRALRARLVRLGHERVRFFTMEKTISDTVASYYRGWRRSVETRHSPGARPKSHVFAGAGNARRTVLFVTHIPMYPPGAGNEIRLYNLVRHLKSRDYRVGMVFCPLDGRPPSDAARAEIAKYVDHFYEVSDEDRRRAASRPSALYESLLEHQEPGIRRWLGVEDSFCPKAAVLRTHEVLQALKPGVLIAEYIWMSRILKLAGPGCLRMVDLHDKFSDKADKVSSFGVEDALATTATEEAEFLSRCDIAIAIQDVEAQAFRQMGVRSLVITSGVDFPAVPCSEPLCRDGYTVLIVASGNKLNVKCIQDFMDRGWPMIRGSEKRARLRVVGRVCDSLNAADSTIELAGYRPDLGEEYGRAHLVVNPVAAGTGLRIKSLEALSHARALVARPEAVEGIPVRDGVDCMVGHDWADLSGKILAVLHDDGLRRQLGSGAYQLSRTWLAPDRVYGELVKCLTLFGRP